MLAVVTGKFKESVAAATTWPVRWRNDFWPSGTLVSDGDMPIDATGLPIPCIEAEIIGGIVEGRAGTNGSVRLYRRDGLLRLYVSVAVGCGTTLIDAECDSLESKFSRKTIFLAPLTSQQLVTYDARTDDRTSAYSEGNRYVKTVSCPWTFDYFQ